MFGKGRRVVVWQDESHRLAKGAYAIEDRISHSCTPYPHSLRLGGLAYITTTWPHG